MTAMTDRETLEQAQTALRAIREAMPALEALIARLEPQMNTAAPLVEPAAAPSGSVSQPEDLAAPAVEVKTGPAPAAAPSAFAAAAAAPVAPAKPRLSLAALAAQAAAAAPAAEDDEADPEADAPEEADDEPATEAKADRSGAVEATAQPPASTAPANASATTPAPAAAPQASVPGKTLMSGFFTEIKRWDANPTRGFPPAGVLKGKAAEQGRERTFFEFKLVGAALERFNSFAGGEDVRLSEGRGAEVACAGRIDERTYNGRTYRTLVVEAAEDVFMVKMVEPQQDTAAQRTAPAASAQNAARSSSEAMTVQMKTVRLFPAKEGKPVTAFALAQAEDGPIVLRAVGEAGVKKLQAVLPDVVLACKRESGVEVLTDIQVSGAFSASGSVFLDNNKRRIMNFTDIETVSAPAPSR